MISVAHLSRRYGAQLAVNDVSFEIGKGEVVGFLGPNGAGKSTTLRILAGFLGPTSGKVTIAGHDVVDDSLEARRCVGYMPETTPLYTEMRVVEFLRFRAELKRVPRRLRSPWVDDAMAKAGVLDVAHRRIGHLSKGYRQRVGLADAVVARPPIVILDEPTAGLDPNQIRETRELVRDLGRDHTVLLSTHILGEVEACASRVLLIHRGKLLADGPTASVGSMRAPMAIELVVRGVPEDAERALLSVTGVTTVSRLAAAPTLTGLRVSFGRKLPESERAAATEACVGALVAVGVGIREVRAAGGSLEEVFGALTRDEDAGDEGEA